MSRRMFLLFLFLLPLMKCYSVQPAKILFYPINMNSHILYFSRLAETLGNLGHKTVLLAPSNANIPKNSVTENFTITVYNVPEEIPYASSKETSEELVQLAISKSRLWKTLGMAKYMKEFLFAIESDCRHLLENKKIMKELEDFQFDFAIMDPIGVYCRYLLPFPMEIPYASFSISAISLIYRVPRLPSFSSVMTGSTDEMTFSERLLSVISELTYTSILQESRTDLAEKYVPQKKLDDARDLLINSSLWFYLEDNILGYPQPHMPNTIAIGDIMARPAKPVPQDLNEFLEKSKNGAIVVSFGSYFDYVPEFVARSFCDAFRNTTYNFLWKLKNPEFCENIPNVRILSWLPQNDLIGHKNVKLFITHGGFNSISEAVYHGKPMIIMPLIGDQLGNAAAMSSKGCAIRMDIAAFTTEELRANIEKMMKDKSFSNNAKHASAILRDKHQSPAERASYMIEHVLKYGDKHLRTGAFKLTTFQFLMFDVFAFLIGMLIFFLILITCILRCSYNFAKKYFTKAEKKKLA